MQVFSNPTPITQCSINPQKNKNKPPLVQSSTNTPHALKNATSLGVGMRESSQVPSLPFLFPLINTRTRKVGLRDAPLALRDFSRSDKQKMWFQLPLNKSFCHTPPLFTHRQFKHIHSPHETKINKIVLSDSPSSVSHKFTIS